MLIEIEQVDVARQAANILRDFAWGIEKPRQPNDLAMQMVRSRQSLNFVAAAEALIKTGRIEEAKELSSQTLNLSFEVEGTPGWLEILGATIQMLIKTGQYDLAKQAAEPLLVLREGYSQAQSNAFIAAAKSMVRIGQIDMVLDAAKMATESYVKAEAFTVAIRELLASGQIEAAKIAVETATDATGNAKGHSLSSVLCAAIEVLVKTEQIASAYSLAVKPTDAEVQTETYVALASALKEIGLIEEAKNAAETALVAAENVTSDDGSRSTAFSRVVPVLAMLGMFRLARECADKCNFSSQRLSAYAAILLEYTKLKNPTVAKLFEEEQQKGD